MRVAINGFGRIGRSVFRAALDNGIGIVAVNDIHGVEGAAYLLKHDSVYGNYPKPVKIAGNGLVIENKKILVLSEKNPEKLPWRKLKIDVVIESTGVFRERKEAMKHIKAGAKRVLISAVADDADLIIVPGVNDKLLERKHKIISVASCTTNCLAPVAKVLHDNFGIIRGFMTTVHAYTTSQSVLDSYQRKTRRSRAAALNIVPTSSGATTAVAKVIPELKGKINGVAMRVPVPCGSIVDFVAEIKHPATIEEVNLAFKKAAQGNLKGILEYSEDYLVSSDIIGNAHSSVFDSLSTQIIGNMVKVLAWYDNEFGYSNRLVDVIKMLKRV